MHDIKALIVRNDLALEQDKVNHLLSLINTKSLSYLSPEKEGGPFLLYCCGDDLRTIATKVNLPPEVILLTAIQYRWPEKAKNLQRDITEQGMGQIQREMSKSLLVATYISMQKQLGDVIAGRVDPDKCGLIPKNMQGLEKLMTMINDIMTPKEAKGVGGSAGTTNIKANNVQVVQQSGNQALSAAPIEEIDPAKQAAHEAKLKALESL